MPFRFRSLGTLVALGHRTAAAEIRGRRFSGVVAWLLWRGIYLAKLPGPERRIRVLSDWVLGPLTLLPVLSGGSPAWSAEDLAAAFPALVGHLAYDAVLGLVVQRLRERADPWWLARSESEARAAEERRRQARGSVPAVWGLTVFLALVIPLLVAG